MIFPVTIMQRVRYHGPGVISGLVTIDGSPKPGFMIYLLEGTRVIMETITDGTGAYSFVGLDMAYKYDIVAIDPTGTWETKVSSRRSPIEVTP